MNLSDILLKLESNHITVEERAQLADQWLEIKIRHYVDLYKGQVLLELVNKASKRYYKYLTA